MIDDRKFTAELTTSLRHLRAFGRSLCRDPQRVDDLVQQTLLQAWIARRRLRTDSKIRSWLFTILRNCYYTELRRRRYELEGAEGMSAAGIELTIDYEIEDDLASLCKALQALPEPQREALTLVVSGGFSYAEAGRRCGCKESTVKSRIARAREHLRSLLGGSAMPYMETQHDAVADGHCTTNRD